MSSTRTAAYQQFLQSICENLDQERTKEFKILRYAVLRVREAYALVFTKSLTC